MRPIEWLDFMSVGLGPWDDGRRDLLALLNRLTDPGEARGQADVLHVTEALITAAERHFAMEEAEMVRAGYPLATLHQHRHGQILAALQYWRGRVQHDWRSGLGANLFLSIAPALFRHYGDHDRRFGRFCAGDHTAAWRLAA